MTRIAISSLHTWALVLTVVIGLLSIEILRELRNQQYVVQGQIRDLSEKILLEKHRNDSLEKHLDASDTLQDASKARDKQ